MKKLLLIIFSLVLITQTAHPQRELGRKERKILYNSSYNYEIQALGVGQDGTKVIKVWGYGKSVEDAVQVAKRNAVAACIFSGIPAGPGVATTPAIVEDPNAAEEYADYFEEFFQTGGKYLNYISLSTDGAPSGSDRLKIKRKYYKVGVSAQVMYDNLRNELEQEGIARRLDKGF
ncbi:MAG: hypothetical protein ACOCXD_03520 [Bacteroidota bacterium]